MKKKLQVLHVISSFDQGGAEVLLSDVIHNRHHCKFDLHVIANTKGPLLIEIQSSGFEVTIQKRKGIDFHFIRFIRKYIKEYQPDIVHVHDIMNGWNILLACLFSDIKIVFTVHGWGRTRKKYLLMKFVDQICYVSNALKVHINAKHTGRESILYNGISPEKFTNSENSFKRELNLSADTYLLGFVGNFNTVRDQLTVCKALRHLKEKGIDFTFLFVGAAHIKELYNACYSYCEEHNLLENVKFLGSRSDVPEILAALDLFVYSSNHDTFGIAVVEAMMSGTPVVVNDLEVFKEITDGGRYARLYKTGDESDLAVKITEMLSSEKKRVELAKKSKIYALNNFSIKKHIDSLNELYSKLLQ